jgi:HAD superfamily hydrolase (TIGR01509 family)
MIKSIIFDLYGTLLFKPKFNIYNVLFKELNYSKEKIDFYKNKLLTNKNINFENLINEDHRKDIDIDYYYDMIKKDIDSINILENNTLEVLTSLKNKYKLYLLSNVSSEYELPYYRLGLNEYFIKSFFSCNIGYRKPDKEAFNYVLGYSRMSPKELLMIGDSERSDVDGATSVGIKGILKNKPLEEIVKENNL